MTEDIFDTNNSLSKELEPVLLDILSKGFMRSQRSKLVNLALVSLAMTPISWIAIILKNIIHLIILGVLWFFLDEHLATYAPLHIVFYTLVLFGIFYKDIYREILDLIIHLVQIFSGGSFLVWVAEGFLENAPVRIKIMKSKAVQTLAVVSQTATPQEFIVKWDHFIDLYGDQNQEGNADRLRQDIVEYWESLNKKDSF